MGEPENEEGLELYQPPADEPLNEDEIYVPMRKRMAVHMKSLILWVNFVFLSLLFWQLGMDDEGEGFFGSGLAVDSLLFLLYFILKVGIEE